ncbi:DNA starvation/stationary phase protection protein, partial [Pseudomonas aeruginosa]
KGIEAAGEEGDDPTQDIFIDFKAATEKRIWMIQAHLGKAPGIDA